jgi:hypothetical protein
VEVLACLGEIVGRVEPPVRAEEERNDAVGEAGVEERPRNRRNVEPTPGRAKTKWLGKWGGL